MNIFNRTNQVKEVGFRTFTGLEYLKIDTANQAGKDKLNFEDRIKWFDETIKEQVVTMNNQELKDYIYTFNDVDSHEGLFASLLAYQDYFYGRPSGRMVGCDSTASGTQLMSCLMCEEYGLIHTGLLGNERGDVYTAIYKEFLKEYKLPINKTRAEIKSCLMTHFYGSFQVPWETLDRDENQYNAFINTIKRLLRNIEELKTLLVESWNPNCTEYSWYLPDGFMTYSEVKTMNKYTQTIDGVEIQFEIKEKGTRKKSVELPPNMIHSVDSLIVREMQRRCSFDVGHYQQVLWYLNQVKEELYEPVEQKELEKLGKLGELIYLYEKSKFCTVRIVDYIKHLHDCYKLSKSHRTKLISIIELMLKQGNIPFLGIHDQFNTLPMYMNFIRYWYKEMCADLTESNTLMFLLEQINGMTEDPINPNRRKELASRIRNSNYGLC